MWPKPAPPQQNIMSQAMMRKGGLWVVFGIIVAIGAIHTWLVSTVLRMPVQQLIFSVVLLVIASSISLFLLLRGGYRERPQLTLVLFGLVGMGLSSLIHF
jgi:predicted neutral ceramidase superfamily lipid hydrolase